MYAITPIMRLASNIEDTGGMKVDPATACLIILLTELGL